MKTYGQHSLDLNPTVWERMSNKEQIELSLITPLYTYTEGKDQVLLYSQRSLLKRRKLVKEMNEKYSH